MVLIACRVAFPYISDRHNSIYFLLLIEIDYWSAAHDHMTQHRAFDTTVDTGRTDYDFVSLLGTSGLPSSMLLVCW